MRILLAVDGSRSAEHATALVAALPWREGGYVRIVSVAPPNQGVPETWGLPDVESGREDVGDDRATANLEALRLPFVRSSPPGATSSSSPFSCAVAPRA